MSANPAADVGRATLAEVEGVEPWTTLGATRDGVTYVELRAASVINLPERTGMAMASLNPYAGCEIGCAYCGARGPHRAIVACAGQADPAVPPAVDFERRILVKLEAPEVLERQLDAHTLRGRMLFVSTATDPYQPAERRYRITRRCLEVLARRGEGPARLQVKLCTKSALILRDLDVLQLVARRHRLTVAISLNTLDATIARRVEPKAPTPAARLRTIGRLADAGLTTVLLASPILPGLTSSAADLEALLSAAKAAGASGAQGGAVLHLAKARELWWRLLERDFPHLIPLYAELYSGGIAPPPDYQRALLARFAEIARRLGLPFILGPVVTEEMSLSYREDGDL